MKNVGANYSENKCEFIVWAPEKETVQLHLLSGEEQTFEMNKDEEGYFSYVSDRIAAGEKYFYSINGTDEKFPDPASHFQPDGVHGPSGVVDHTAYQWKDASWNGLPMQDLIFYEIHVGTFTPEGTFDAIINRLDDLAETGINALEIMPISQFPGSRNWGYDGVFPYAVQNSYGGPDKFKQLIDEAHKRGIAVFLDVVFNHLGPEGNYIDRFGPYFTDRYCTPWGDAINLDGDWSDGVRTYFANSILHWYEHYHLDGLRVDAVHMMYDSGAVHFWEVVNEKLNQLRQRKGKDFYLIAECDLNSPRVVQSPENGGWGFNAQWLDDFHHALYVLLDPEGIDRYEDFGQMEQLAKAYTDGFVHSGEFVKFRKRKHGKSSVGLPGETFVVFNQNHDQVGNRVGGERLCMLINFEKQKLGAAAILLAPYIPMLFMGEEFSADTPFFYFVSHSDEELIQMVVEGRRKEFENYKWEVDPPNPQEEETFLQSKLKWDQRLSGKHRVMLDWFKTLIRLRRTAPALLNFDKNFVRVSLFGSKGFALHRKSADEKQELICIFNLGSARESMAMPARKGHWKRILDSRDPQWMEGDVKLLSTFPELAADDEIVFVAGESMAVYETVL
jgi:maltooligosyltrehalose trehalohydrolase